MKKQTIHALDIVSSLSFSCIYAYNYCELWPLNPQWKLRGSKVAACNICMGREAHVIVTKMRPCSAHPPCWPLTAGVVMGWVWLCGYWRRTWCSWMPPTCTTWRVALWPLPTWTSMASLTQASGEVEGGWWCNMSHVTVLLQYNRPIFVIQHCLHSSITVMTSLLLYPLSSSFHSSQEGHPLITERRESWAVAQGMVPAPRSRVHHSGDGIQPQSNGDCVVSNVAHPPDLHTHAHTHIHTHMHTRNCCC